MAIFYQHTRLVEPLSLDEAYLDVTGSVQDLNEAVKKATEIKQQIREQTQLTASAGISYCKFLAKIASDRNKPDGLTVITPQEASSFLDALPIEKFFGVGKVTAARLREMDIHTGADLKRLGERNLRELLGKHGAQLYHYASGEDNRAVEPVRVRKSVGKEVTLERDISDRREMEHIFAKLATQVEHRLVELELAGKTLTLKIRWSNFDLVTRAVSTEQGFQQAEEMLPILYTQLSRLVDGKQTVRLLGVIVSNLYSQDAMARERRIVRPSLWLGETTQE